MKNSNQRIQERRQEIVELLKEKKQLTVQEISSSLSVSEITIRRDLSTLDKMGLLQRTHGGAQLLSNKSEKSQLDTKITKIKDCLAAKAAEFVHNDDTIFLNTSSTALNLVRHLGDKRVNIITNNIKIINMDVNPNSTVILSGGEIRFPKESLVGDVAIDSFSKMSSNISVIGCSGISSECAITTPILHEAKINSLILERTKGVRIVVADYRKIGFTSNFISGYMHDIDFLITDTFANPDMLNAIERMGVQIIQVDTN